MEEEICENIVSTNHDENTLHESSTLEEDREVEPTFDFKMKTWASDLVLSVEEKRLYVSKTVLGLASPVFKRMFQAGFKEETCEEIELPGKKYDDMLEFLQCIYPSIMKSVDFDNVLEMLPLFEEYQVSHGKPICENVLLEFLATDISTEKLFQILQAAHVYNMRKVSEKCIEVAILRQKQQLDSARLKVKPPAGPLIEILDKKYGILENEVEESKRMLTEMKEINEENELLKTYCQQLARRKGTFDAKLNWKGDSGSLVNDITKQTSSSTVLKCWGKDLNITTQVISGWLNVLVRCTGKFVSKAKLHIVVVNRYGTNEDIEDRKSVV